MSYPRPENFFLVRFLVVGAGRVGKTSIINRFVDKEFKEQTKTEKFVEYLSRYAYMNDNKDFVKALILNVPCLDISIHNNNGFRVCIAGCIYIFDLSDRTSIDEIRIWNENLDFPRPKFPLFRRFMVGHQKSKWLNRQISYEEAS